MSARIQVVVDEAEREAFRRQAERDGIPLSAWLRDAGRRRLDATAAHPLRSVEELDAFFAGLPVAPGAREPDWDAHKRRIAAGRAAGGSGT